MHYHRPTTTLSLAGQEAISLGLPQLAKPSVLVPNITGCIVLYCIAPRLWWILAAAISSGSNLRCGLLVCMSVHAVLYVGMVVYMHMLLFTAGGGDCQLSGHIMVQMKCVGFRPSTSACMTMQSHWKLSPSHKLLGSSQTKCCVCRTDDAGQLESRARGGCVGQHSVHPSTERLGASCVGATGRMLHGPLFLHSTAWLAMQVMCHAE